MALTNNPTLLGGVVLRVQGRGAVAGHVTSLCLGSIAKCTISGWMSNLKTEPIVHFLLEFRARSFKLNEK